MGLQRLVDMITFPAPSSSYSLTSHLDELFFITDPLSELCPIPCMYISPGARRKSMFVLVHTHSNGCDIGDMVTAMRGLSAHLMVDSFLVEYPGYGLYEGKTSKASIDRTMEVIHNFFIHELKIEPSRIIWYGRSIGSGSACALALRTQELFGPESVGGLVIQCGFTCFKDVVKFLFGRVAKSVVRQSWDNKNAVAQLERTPVLILHGKRDTMIPHKQAVELFEVVRWKEVSELYLCNCGHNDFNFPKCTVQPMVALLGRIVAKRQITTPISRIHISFHLRPLVIHVGLLRNRIPCHTLRRLQITELETKLAAAGRTAATKEQEAILAQGSESGSTGAGGPTTTGTGDASASSSGQGGSADNSVASGSKKSASSGGGSASNGGPNTKQSGPSSSKRSGTGQVVASGGDGAEEVPPTPGSAVLEPQNTSVEVSIVGGGTTTTTGGAATSSQGGTVSGNTAPSTSSSSGKLKVNASSGANVAEASESRYIYAPTERTGSAGEDGASKAANAGGGARGSSASSGQDRSENDQTDAECLRTRNRKCGGCVPAPREIEELVCDICLDSLCPYLTSAEPNELAQILQKPRASELKVGMFHSVRVLLHHLTKRAVRFFHVLRAQLDQLEGPETLQIADLIEVVQAEFWLRCPFPILYEEVLLLRSKKRSRISVLSFGAFKILEIAAGARGRSSSKGGGQQQQAAPTGGTNTSSSGGGTSSSEVPLIASSAGNYEEVAGEYDARTNLENAIDIEKYKIFLRKMLTEKFDFSVSSPGSSNKEATSKSSANSTGPPKTEQPAQPTSTAFPRLPESGNFVTPSTSPGVQRGSRNAAFQERNSSTSDGASLQASLLEEVDEVVDVLRIPIWGFAPSNAQFRYITEWCLLSSERLDEMLPLTVKDLLSGRNAPKKRSKSAAKSSPPDANAPFPVNPDGMKGYHKRKRVIGGNGKGKRSGSADTPRPAASTKKQGKLPPTVLDLSAAFSSHYVQLMRQSVPQRVSDIFEFGSELVTGYTIARSSAVACGRGRAVSEAQFAEMLGDSDFRARVTSLAELEMGRLGVFEDASLLDDIVTTGTEERQTDVKLDDVPTVSKDEIQGSLAEGAISARSRSKNEDAMPSLGGDVDGMSGSRSVGSSPKASLRSPQTPQEAQNRLAALAAGDENAMGGANGNAEGGGSRSSRPKSAGGTEIVVGATTAERKSSSSSSGGAGGKTKGRSSKSSSASATLQRRPSVGNSRGVDLLTLNDHFGMLRHGFMSYRPSPSRLREVIFEATDTISEVLLIWLTTEKMRIPTAEDVIESVEIAADSSIFVGDFFAAVLLKHYEQLSRIPLGLTQGDPRAMAMRKYLHFNFHNLFKPEVSGGPRYNNTRLMQALRE
ncbi:unnamed protein product [Amoebophrya sp. A25]|nr:unnamed protein product [Amoebophrya sp. A25]|eukprot:GSA25T00015517001.1